MDSSRHGHYQAQRKRQAPQPPTMPATLHTQQHQHQHQHQQQHHSGLQSSGTVHSQPVHHRSMNNVRGTGTVMPATSVQQQTASNGSSGANQIAHGNSHHESVSSAASSSADDLHAWSLFRQNLNANFSNSALHHQQQHPQTQSHHQQQQQPQASQQQQQQQQANSHHHSGANSHGQSNGNSAPNKSHHHQSPNSGYPNHSPPLRDSTVTALLSNPKYGEQMKNQDTFTYLRFGLPRVKVTNPRTSRGPDPPIIDHQPPSRQNQHFKSSKNLNEQDYKRKYWNSSEATGRISELESSGKDSDGSGREILPSRRDRKSSTSHHNHHHHHHHHREFDDTEFETELDEPRVSQHKSRLNYHSRSKEHLDDSSDDQAFSQAPNTVQHQEATPRAFQSRPVDPFEEDIRLDEMLSTHPPLAKHPHLVVKDLNFELDKSANWRRLCGFSRQKLRVLEDINFDVLGGEIMAVLATSEPEGTALLNVLADRHDRRNGHVRAEMYLNGVSISPRTLSRVSTFVPKSQEFCADMSTRQALLFAGMLLTPAQTPRGSSGDIKRRTRTILEELNLGEVRHTRIAELTESERKRLQIATHLLLDTELLMLDQPLDGLDIFDAFFLVEYLRQWAAVGGRVVIMTLQPPTYEVFTMLNKVLLLSSGRSLFVGQRRDLLKHFTSLDFGCPPYKNPSDYYLDLVTVDSLSQEALIESSQRIEALADVQARKPLVELFSSMPGPPAVMPAPYRRANFAMQFLALWIRALIFSFPYNVVRLFSRFMGAMIVSLAIGGVYWQVRTGREQEFVWDRVGFVTTMLTIGLLPVLLSDIWSAFKEKCFIESEIEQRFYTLPSYLFAKVLYSAPATILLGLAYSLPACSMAGLHLHLSPNSLSLYLLLMIGYYFALRMSVIGLVWACRKRSTATAWFGALFTVWCFASGSLLHVRDIAFTHRWLRLLSPIRWIHESLIGWEFEPNVINSGADSLPASATSAFLCSRNPVVQQPNAILVRADCGFQTRANILKWFDYSGGNSSSAATVASSGSSLATGSGSLALNSDLRHWWHSLIAFGIIYLASFLLGSIIFCLRAYYFRSHIANPTKSRINQRRI